MNTILASPSSPSPAPANDAAAPVVCFTNIGPREQRRRMVFGVAAYAIGFALAALLIWTGVAPLWRALLFLPFAAGGIGYFQARDKT
jgi:hypothetical protein